MVIRSVVLLSVVVVVVTWRSADSRGVRKSSQHNASLDQTKIQYKLDGEEKSVGYHFYGGKKRIILPIDEINTNGVLSQSMLLIKRGKNISEKKSKLSSMQRAHKKRRNKHPKPRNHARVQPRKKYSTNAFRKDSLVDLLQTNAKNVNQYKRSNETAVSLGESQQNKEENANVPLHDVLKKDNQQEQSEKLDVEEIKKGLGKIVSQLQTVLKQDYLFLRKNATNSEHKKKKVDLRKLAEDVAASQNNKNDESNEDSIVLNPKQKLKVSDLQISKDLNLNGNAEEHNGMMNAQPEMEMDGWNGMNQINQMNGMQSVTGLNEINSMNGMGSPNGFNGIHMDYMMGANGPVSPYPPITMNNLIGMNDLNSNVPEDLSMVPPITMPSNFHGHERENWLDHPSMEDDEQVDEEEEPRYHLYPKHRPHYYRIYEEDNDVRYTEPRYREEEDEDVDREQSKEYENADERATINPRYVHLRKHRFNDKRRLQKVHGIMGSTRKVTNHSKNKNS